MNASDLNLLIQHELDQLLRETELYKSSADMWRVIPGTLNSGGNLALHLVGNLRHFIGAVLGGSGYIRNRDFEFSARDVDRSAIIAEISVCKEDVSASLKRIDPAIYDKPFPVEIGGKQYNTGYTLLLLLAHFTYHLGQINYHRRFLTEKTMEL